MHFYDNLAAASPHNLCCCWAPSVGSLQVTGAVLHRQIKATFPGCFGFGSTFESLSPSATSPQPRGCRACLLWMVSPVARWSLIPYICLSVIPLSSSLNVIWSSSSSFWKYSPCIRSHSFQSRPLHLIRTSGTWHLKLIYTILPHSVIHAPFTDYCKIQILMVWLEERNKTRGYFLLQYAKQSRLFVFRWSLRVIARSIFFSGMILKREVISSLLWEQKKPKESFATRFPSQTTLKLYPNCSAREAETCRYTCTTLLENVKKNLIIIHFVLIY